MLFNEMSYKGAFILSHVYCKLILRFLQESKLIINIYFFICLLRDKDKPGRRIFVPRRHNRILIKRQNVWQVKISCFVNFYFILTNRIS